MSKRQFTVSSLAMLWVLVGCDPSSEPMPNPADDSGIVGAGESAGFSADGLDALDRGIQSVVDEGRVAGMVTMLARHGTVVHSASFGYQDADKQIPMQSDTIFRIYSMTKPVTGVAMMILYERGLWNLDDPVSKHIPEFAGLSVAEESDDGEITLVPADHAMTMKELMSHSGGLTYGGFSQSAVDTLYQQTNVLDSNSSQQAMIDKLAAIPLRQQPGSMWHYSVSTDVQGYIVEKLSGQTLPEFFEEQIFRPLGMVDTGFYVTAEETDRFVKEVYRYGSNGELVPSPGLMLRDYSKPHARPSGGGGLVSTVSDFMSFAQMLLNGGEHNGIRILSTETVELMRTDHAPTTRGMGAIQLPPGTGFGLNVAITVNPASSASPLGAGSYWWAGIGGTWFWIDPVNDLIFVALTQHSLKDILDLFGLTQQLTYASLVDPAE